MQSKIIKRTAWQRDNHDINEEFIDHELSGEYLLAYEIFQIKFESDIICYIFNNEFQDLDYDFKKAEKGDQKDLSINFANEFIKYIQINYSQDLEKEIERDIDLADNLLENYFSE